MSADNLENGDTKNVQYKHAAGQMYRLAYIRQSAIGTTQWIFGWSEISGHTDSLSYLAIGQFCGK